MKIIKIDNQKLIELYKIGNNTYEIAKIFNCNPCTIQRRLKKIGIKLRKKEIDITNKIFGKLTAKYKLSETKWFCICDCGKHKNCIKERLLDGRNTSCGCASRNKGNSNPSWTGFNEISGSLFARIKNNAINRNIQFSISIEELWSLYLKQNKKCALSGIEIIMPLYKDNNESGKNLASLDRIDSNKPYVIDNVQWVDKDINYMKMDLSQSKFIYLCRKIYQYNEGIIY